MRITLRKRMSTRWTDQWTRGVGRGHAPRLPRHGDRHAGPGRCSWGPGPCPLSSSRCAADRAVSSRRRGSAGLALGRAGSRGGLLEGRVGPGGASVGAVATKISVQATDLSSRGSLPLSATYPAASPPRLRVTKIEWPSGARRRWACPNGCSQPPLRGDGRVCHLLGYTPRRLSPPRLLVRKHECPSSCNAD